MKPDMATVLVADDEPELLEIFATWLQRCHYRVLTAANGAEALKLLESSTVDVLISDIRMPIMDGPTLVRRIQQSGRVIPSIIFVSGFGDIDPREMHALGVEAMIEKPLSRQTLLRALEDSIMKREELWLVPMPSVRRQAVSIDFTHPGRDMQAKLFEMGRGGCCFPCDLPLARGQTIDLTIRFAEDARCLQAHGEVRWYCRESALAGMAFRYLAPACRDWVFAAMNARMPRSFIPSGHSAVQKTAGPELLPAKI